MGVEGAPEPHALAVEGDHRLEPIPRDMRRSGERLVTGSGQPLHVAPQERYGPTIHNSPDPGRADGGLRSARARVLAQADEERHEPLADAEAESVAAAAGLTILSSPGLAWARERSIRAVAPPLKGRGFSMTEMIAEAKKEGHLNTIALPPDWANYGEMIVDVPEEVRHLDHERQPGRQLGAGEPGGAVAQGRLACAGRRRRRRPRSRSQAPPQGLFAKYFVSEFNTIPRAMKDTRGYWTGDYWGAISIGYNASLVKTPPKTWADLLKPDYKGKVALNGSPLTSGSAVAGVFAAALANGGSAEQRPARASTSSRKLKSVGQLHPGADSTPQTVASGQTPISIDWDYLNLAYVEGVPGGELEGHRSRPTACTAPTTARRSTPPLRTRGRRASGRSSSTPTRARSSGSRATPHPARFQDLAARKVIPARRCSRRFRRRPSTRRCKFASIGQQTNAKNAHRHPVADARSAA